MNHAKRALLALFLTCLVVCNVPTTAQTWSQLVTVGSPPGGPAVTAYDPVNNLLIALFASPSGAQVWVLSYANGLGGTPTWSQLAPSGSAPVPTGEETAVYDPVSNQLIVHGGCSASCGSPLPTVSVLSYANGLGGTPVWVQSVTSPSLAREAQSAVYNPATRRLVSFAGGLAYFGSDQNDTSVLQPANGAFSNWTTLTPSGSPPGIREGQTAIYDQKHNIMTVFGGDQAVSTCCPYNVFTYDDTWVLTNADGSAAGAPTWTQLSPTGGPPPARTLHSAVYDSGKNTMYIYGGLLWSNATQNNTILGDIWKLTNADGRAAATPKWTQVGQLGTPPGASFSQGMAIDEVNQRIIVVAGRDRNYQNDSVTFILDLLRN